MRLPRHGDYALQLMIVLAQSPHPGQGWRLSTVAGDLQGREVELLLVLVEADRTMVFMRYFGAMRSMGATVRTVLSVLPDLEAPVYASAAAYHLRSYKNEAEKRAGYIPPKIAAVPDFGRLHPSTILQLCKWYGGMVRETSTGKGLDATAFTSINAPQEAVFPVNRL